MKSPGPVLNERLREQRCLTQRRLAFLNLGCNPILLYYSGQGPIKMNTSEEHKLQNKGVRPTAMRILVLQYLTQLGHTSSLFDLENHFDHADKSTLYRTLKTFEEKGIVHKIDDGSGIIKYGLCSESCQCILADQHFHFHCEKCGETYCMSGMQIPNLELPSKFILKQSNLVLKGICANCN